jgi:6-phosphogluconolactonase
MNLQIFDTLEAASHAAARDIERRVVGGARIIALSGGSTPELLHTLLGRSEAMRAQALTWVQVDERFVPIGDPQSNAGMIERTLFADGVPPLHRFLRFRTELGEPAAVARAYEAEWPGTPDIIVLGVGDDGHTASLFPGTDALQVEDRIAVENRVEKLDTWRLTLTKPVIRAAPYRLVLAAGASKKPVIDALKSGADYPIAQVTNGVETWWFVDWAAVG